MAETGPDCDVPRKPSCSAMAGFKVPVVSLGVKGPGSVVLPGERTHPRAELQAAAGGRAHMELVTPARRRRRRQERNGSWAREVRTGVRRPGFDSQPCLLRPGNWDKSLDGSNPGLLICTYSIITNGVQLLCRQAFPTSFSAGCLCRGLLSQAFKQ